MYILCKDVVNWEIVTANQRKKYVHDYCDLLIVFGSIIINSFKIRTSPLFTILQNKQVIIVYSFLFVQSNLCIELVNSLVKLTPHPQVGNVLIESLISHCSPSPRSLRILPKNTTHIRNQRTIPAYLLVCDPLIRKFLRLKKV